MNELVMKKPQTNATVLSLYPNARGISYAVMDSPTQMVESGIRGYSPVCNAKCFRQALVYLEYFQPDVVILENTTTKIGKPKPRVEKLLNRIEHEAKEKGLSVFRYNRENICTVFMHFGGMTKHRINQAIVKAFPKLLEKLPKKRKHGNPEEYFQGEFDAISLAITHFYLKSTE